MRGSRRWVWLLLVPGFLAVAGCVQTRATLEGVHRLEVVDGPALLVDHLAQFLGHLVVHTTEIEAVEGVLTPLADLLEDLPHPLDPVAVAVLEALLEHAPEGCVDVTVVEEVVGQLLHDIQRVELEAPLGAVPG